MSTVTTVAVTGMSCQHCVDAVTAELSRLDGVADVRVDLDDAAATITSAEPLDPATIVAAVEEAGYEATVR